MDFIKAFLGNSSVNKIQRMRQATIEEALFSVVRAES